MKLNIVILAAGMGKRMQSDKPKVLHTLAGKPMVQHVIDSARALNPDRIIIVVGHQAEHLREALVDQPDLAFALQQPQLGTGHAVAQAVPLLLQSNVEMEAAKDVTLVLYGDVPLVRPNTLQRLLEIRQHGFALLTEYLSDPTGYGRIIRDHHGFVNKIVEHKDANPSELEVNEVNTGILAAPTARLKEWLAELKNDNAQGEYYLTDTIGFAVRDGLHIHTTQPEHPWETLGVNSRLQQAQLERTWQREQARQLMEQGVALADPARIDIRGHLSCGKDVFIDVGCVFEGDVHLADGVQVGPYCIIRQSSIGKGSRLEAYSHISEAQVLEEAVIGPYARLRPGTLIDNEAHVGNFTELKKTHLGPKSKANHLSYLGDATIGARVNIGAGTITCNYDGVNKFQTIIEDDAFIGSDSQLVAPVTIGQGATLAAGTTLIRNAPKDTLTLSRKEQISRDTWQRPTKKK